jgi:isopentenyldiphosphate isomerase
MDKLLKKVDENGFGIESVFESKCHHDIKILHERVHCFLITKTGGFIFQKKVTGPLTNRYKWDIGISEHVYYKETPEKAISRSLKDTLGIISSRTPKLFREYISKTDGEEEYIKTYLLRCDPEIIKFNLNERSSVGVFSWSKVHLMTVRQPERLKCSLESELLSLRCSILETKKDEKIKIVTEDDVLNYCEIKL